MSPRLALNLLPSCQKVSQFQLPSHFALLFITTFLNEQGADDNDTSLIRQLIIKTSRHAIFPTVANLFFHQNPQGCWSQGSRTTSCSATNPTRSRRQRSPWPIGSPRSRRSRRRCEHRSGCAGRRATYPAAEGTGRRSNHHAFSAEIRWWSRRPPSYRG